MIFISQDISFASTEKLTKKNWLKINEQRKIYYVIGKMEEYQKKGKVFDKSVHDYIALLDQKAKQNPKAPDLDMDSLFADIV